MLQGEDVLQGLGDRDCLAGQDGERLGDPDPCVLEVKIEDQGVRVNILPASVSWQVTLRGSLGSGGVSRRKQVNE